MDSTIHDKENKKPPSKKKRSTSDSSKPKSSRNKHVSKTTGREKWHAKKEDSLESAQIDFFKKIGNELTTKGDQPPKVIEKGNDVPESSNYVFARYIAAELDSLPVYYQRIARNEITNVLFSNQTNSVRYQPATQHSPAILCKSARYVTFSFTQPAATSL